MKYAEYKDYLNHFVVRVDITTQDGSGAGEVVAVYASESYKVGDYRSDWYFPSFVDVSDTFQPSPQSDSKKHHVHRDLIIAWANGAEIEVFNVCMCAWNSIDNPNWAPAAQYRIKETGPIVKVLWVGPDEVTQQGVANIRCEFDRDTGELLKVEKI